MTQKELAKLLNISRSTVSLALMDSENINIDTRNRVKALAKKLNYQPNRASQFLVTKKSRTIGVMIPSFRNHFYGELSEEIFKSLHEHNYSALFSFDINLEHYREALDDMVARGVDGILTYPFSMYYGKLAELQAGGLPVLVFNTISDCPLDCIGVDNFRCGYLATKHLLENGRRNIACICYITDPRFNGYRAALGEYGIEFDVDLMFDIDADAENGFQAMTEILRKNPDKVPDAVYCHNDLVAIGAMRAAIKAGYRVPDDIAFVGRDNIDVSHYLNPPLTTIHISRKQMAEKAVDMILEKVDGKIPERRRSQIIEPELIIRESSGADASLFSEAG